MFNTTNPFRASILRTAAWPIVLSLLLFAFVNADRSATAPPMSAPVSSVLTLYSRALPAIVEVLVNDQLSGSGWIADREGHIFTAAHVVHGDKKRIEILTHDEQRLEATLIALDLGRDLALLKLPTREEGYPFLPLAKQTPAAGSEIHLIGAPIYRHAVMLRGSVARNTVTYEYLPTQKTHIETIHVSAASPRGTSGGAWLNDAGQVIGLQSGMMSDQGAAVGIAFVIPVEPIQYLLNTKANVQTATIDAAFEEIWEQSGDFLKKFPQRTQGIVIRVPEPGGAAATVGLREGDVILSVNGKPMRLRDQFISLLRSSKSGDELQLDVLREHMKTPQSFTVKVGTIKLN